MYIYEDDRCELRDLLVRHSLQFGDFTLSSGKKSDYYLDVRQTSLHGRGLRLIARCLYYRITEECPGIDAVGGLTLGADPLVAGILYCANVRRQDPLLHGFLVRKAPKSHGTQRYIEGPLVDGRMVAIVEDVTTTGESAMKAVNAAEDAGAYVAGVWSVVDRQEGAAERFHKDRTAFSSLFTVEELRGHHGQ